MSKEGIDQEEEYFHRREQEKIAKLKAQQEAEAALKEAEDLKALHYFHCGKCGNKMETRIYKGVEIEVCTKCNAVLLDPGELEQLVGEDEGFSMALKNFLGFSKSKAPGPKGSP